MNRTFENINTVVIHTNYLTDDISSLYSIALNGARTSALGLS